jgi:hypothetical protein
MRSPRSDRRRSQLEFSCGSEGGSQPSPINASWHHHGGGRKAAPLRRVNLFELVARNSPGALSFSAPHCHSQGQAMPDSISRSETRLLPPTIPLIAKASATWISHGPCDGNWHKGSRDLVSAFPARQRDQAEKKLRVCQRLRRRRAGCEAEGRSCGLPFIVWTSFSSNSP